MAEAPHAFRRVMPALGAAIPVVIMFIAVLGIVLTAAGPDGLDLTDGETSGWIVVVYGLPAVPSVILSLRYRQPLLLTGNVFAVIFLASLGEQFSFQELSGAALLAGVGVLLLAIFGLTGKLAAWIPAPIVHGLVAGAVLPFVANIFTGLSDVDTRGSAIAARVPIMVGSAFLAYLASRRWLGGRVPAIFPALVVGLAAAAVTDQFGPLPPTFQLPEIAIGWPAFSATAVATATPVLIALIFLQSNLPCIIYMRSQGYRPPERVINVTSGLGTIVASFVGPAAVALAVPLVPLTAGPTAGDRPIRHISVYIPAAALVVIALLAGAAADLAAVVPPSLLLVLAGLALIGVLVSSLTEVARGPLVLGPILAFAIALSDMRLFDLGPFFWSLLIGTGVSLLLERDEWERLREEAYAG
ncbi:MAG: benzoate/H(+) symporter BenE family transporter [Actinomycetota bacterium]|nr:benzoate/H(+) symporter BenE family transporter [Actinomycetota bacterium]